MTKRVHIFPNGHDPMRHLRWKDRHPIRFLLILVVSILAVDRVARLVRESLIVDPHPEYSEIEDQAKWIKANQ